MSEYKEALIVEELGFVVYIPGHPFTEWTRKTLLANKFKRRESESGDVRYEVKHSEGALYAAQMIKQGGV